MIGQQKLYRLANAMNSMSTGNMWCCIKSPMVPCINCPKLPSAQCCQTPYATRTMFSVTPQCHAKCPWYQMPIKASKYLMPSSTYCSPCYAPSKYTLTFHVSTRCVSEYRMLPSVSFGNNSSNRYKNTSSQQV